MIHFSSKKLKINKLARSFIWSYIQQLHHFISYAYPNFSFNVCLLIFVHECLPFYIYRSWLYFLLCILLLLIFFSCPFPSFPVTFRFLVYRHFFFHSSLLPLYIFKLDVFHSLKKTSKHLFLMSPLIFFVSDLP